jgi:predicted GH43/DUF377 family glycosyl hydrolase
MANGMVPSKGEWFLYYGGAHRHIGLATRGLNRQYQSP